MSELSRVLNPVQCLGIISKDTLPPIIGREVFPTSLVICSIIYIKHELYCGVSVNLHSTENREKRSGVGWGGNLIFGEASGIVGDGGPASPCPQLRPGIPGE